MTLNRLRPITEPVWKGPQEEGISQSLLSGYFLCKERFRVMAVEGLVPKECFSLHIEFGQMWHIAEEVLAETKKIDFKRVTEYYLGLKERYPKDHEEIDRWYNIVLVQFPIYVKFWKLHPDVRLRKPLFQEEKFKIPYTLPSKRTVWLRGKFDSVDLIGNEGVFLQENKTKSKIDVAGLSRQLRYDLQVMIYLTALQIRLPEEKICGVRYNVIRRATASGSKGSITRHKGSKTKPRESQEAFNARLATIIKADTPYYFKRWKTILSIADLEQFQRETLNPVLENLCDDYEWWKYCLQNTSTRQDVPSWSPFDFCERSTLFPNHMSRHFRLPYGLYNVIYEGGTGPIDDYLMTGSTLGLVRTKNIFPELV